MHTHTRIARTSTIMRNNNDKNNHNNDNQITATMYENNNTVFSENQAGTRSVQDDGLVVKGAYRLQDHIYIVTM